MFNITALPLFVSSYLANRRIKKQLEESLKNLRTPSTRIVISEELARAHGHKMTMSPPAQAKMTEITRSSTRKDDDFPLCVAPVFDTVFDSGTSSCD